MHDHSLLPYLSGFGSGFSLAFTQSAAAPDTASPQRFPFEIISEAGPLTRILCGSIVSDAGALVKPVFMLLSRDEYALPGGGIAPLANPTSMQPGRPSSRQSFSPAGSSRWQHSLTNRAAPCLQAAVRLYPTPGGSSTRPARSAGQGSTARDDALLAGRGLKQYSRSCRR
jgi:hypothetical protein